MSRGCQVFRQFITLTLVCIGIAAPVTAAADESNLTGSAVIRWVPRTDSFGFVTAVPTIDRAALASHLRNLHATFKQRKHALADAESEKRFSGKDAMLTAILPGGLLYAAYKKRAHDRIKQQLDKVSSELIEIGQALLEWQAMSAKVQLAQAR